MTYLLMNSVFLAALAAAYLVWRPQVSLKRFGLQLLIMLLLTAVFDNLIIHFGIVAYNPQNISGLYIFKAPIEDFSYTIAACLLVPLLWGKQNG